MLESLLLSFLFTLNDDYLEKCLPGSPREIIQKIANLQTLF